MAREKNNGKPGPVTRAVIRYLVGKNGEQDVNSTAVERELRDIVDGKTPPQGGAR
jgi:hypothetical protein